MALENKGGIDLLYQTFIRGRLRDKLLVVCMIGATALAVASLLIFKHERGRDIAGVLLIVSACLYLSWTTSMGVAEQQKTEESVHREQEIIAQDTRKTTVLWRMSSNKLEKYLERNLRQVTLIFRLVVLTTIAGFLLIVYGVYSAFKGGPLQASLLTAGSGALGEFIAVTFLAIHKSTLNQAMGLVGILERIAAVGMAIEVVDQIPDEHKSKNEARAKLALQIMQISRAFGKQVGPKT
jgi:Ca2+/Na+ antiporter